MDIWLLFIFLVRCFLIFINGRGRKLAMKGVLGLEFMRSLYKLGMLSSLNCVLRVLAVYAY